MANWKMYLTLRESVALAKKVSGIRYQVAGVGIVLCPSFVALEEVGKIVRGTRIKLGAQDVEPEKRGAFTGEVGLDDLGEIGVQYVLVGHSERRSIFHETDAMVNRKLRAILDAGMRPILCVGEPLSVRRHGMGKVHRYVGAQIRSGLKGVARDALKRVIIAYEPIWAIGTGQISTPTDTETVHSYIRKILSLKKIQILYGGSVNAKNASSFLKAEGIDGFLVGRASTSAAEFLKILNSV